MKYFLGVDIGGTKSHALIADESGQVVGFGRAGAGNWEGVGYDGLQQVCWLSQIKRLVWLALNGTESREQVWA